MYKYTEEELLEAVDILIEDYELTEDEAIELIMESYGDELLNEFYFDSKRNYKAASKEKERTKADYEAKKAVSDASSKEVKDYDIFGKIENIDSKKDKLDDIRAKRLKEIDDDFDNGKLDKVSYESIQDEIEKDHKKNYDELNSQSDKIRKEYDTIRSRHDNNVKSTNAATKSHINASNNYTTAERKFKSDRTKVRVAAGAAVAGGAYLAHKAYKKHKAKKENAKNDLKNKKNNFRRR